jgi:hypothetical protein
VSPPTVPDVLLERYLAGDLNRRARRALEAQLASSAPLRNRLEDLRSSQQAFLAAEKPEAFAHRVAVRAEVAKPARTPLLRKLSLLVAPAAALAAAAVVVVVARHEPDTRPFVDAEKAAEPQPDAPIEPQSADTGEARGSAESPVAELGSASKARALSQPAAEPQAPAPALAAAMRAASRPRGHAAAAALGEASRVERRADHAPAPSFLSLKEARPASAQPGAPVVASDGGTERATPAAAAASGAAVPAAQSAPLTELKAVEVGQKAERLAAGAPTPAAAEAEPSALAPRRSQAAQDETKQHSERAAKVAPPQGERGQGSEQAAKVPPLEVRGALAVAQVAAVLGSQRTALLKAWLAARPRRETLRLGWTITSAGNVKDARVLAPAVDAALAERLLALVRAWHFPASSGGSTRVTASLAAD